MNKKLIKKTALFMGTVVSVTVVAGSDLTHEAEQAIQNAYESFRLIEKLCSRFDENSQIMQLSKTVNVPVKVHPVLFELIRFSLEVATVTGGAFDPTVGIVMEQQGFNRHYLTGDKIQSAFDADEPVSYKDIVLDEKEKTVRIKKSLIVDLGATAKGLSVDLAAKSLTLFDGFVIDAGGDLFVSGTNEQHTPWTVGIQHPIERDKVICTLQISNAAVCTSGSYERKSPINANVHHLINPITTESENELLSCTVIAPFTMMADAFSTATFILGKHKGMHQLEQLGLDGVLISSSLQFFTTKGIVKYLI